MQGAGGKTLARFMGPWDGVAVAVGIIIGSGIFRTPGGIVRALGDERLVVAVWALGGLLALAGALVMAEVLAFLPETGGLYVVLREAFGRLPAFLFGWAHLVAIKSAATAAIAVVAGEYLARLCGWPPGAVKPVAAVLIATLAASASLSARYGTRVQNVATLAKVAALAAVTLVGLFGPVAGPGLAFAGSHAAPPSMPVGVAAILTAAAVALEGVLWTYDGWADVAPVAGEVREPGRNLPRVIVGAALLVTLLYVAANVAFLRVLGLGGVARAPLVAADAAAVAFGAAGVKLVSAAVFVSAAGAVNGSILAGPRIYFAMARDGAFFSVFGRSTLGSATPAPGPATLLQAGWALVLLAVGGFETLTGYFVFVTWLTYAAAAAALFRLRRARPDDARPFRVPLYPLLPASFFLFATAYLVSSLARGSREALAGAALVATGIPLFLLWRRRGPAPGRP